MTATIYDVARRAGVSISTVSLAVNKPEAVRTETHARVMAAIDDLGYVPKSEAVTRARKGVRRIAVIAPFTSYPSFATRLNGVFRAAKRHHFEIVVYDEESAASARLVTLPLARHVDGLLVMSLPVEEAVVGRLMEQDFPTVLIDSTRPDMSSVTVNDAAGGALVADLFERHGHTRVGYIGHSQSIDYESPSRLRLEGFRERLSAPPVVQMAEHDSKSARDGASLLLSQSDRPTAIFAYDDQLALGVLKAAHDLGISVPGDLEVVGFDDSEVSAAIGLSTVRQPLEESGEIGIDLLVDRLEHPTRPVRHTQLGLVLVERDTTRGSTVASAHSEGAS